MKKIIPALAAFAAGVVIAALSSSGTLIAAPPVAEAPAPASAPVAPAATAPAPAGRASGFEDLSEKLLPTVVNISTSMKVKAAAKGGAAPALPFPPGSPFEDFFKDFYDQQQQQPDDNGAEAPEQKASSLGSGFVIDAAKGYIVTNNHVIRDADEIKVTLNDNTTLDAKLIGTDEKVDVAVLQVQAAKPLTAAAWGDSDAARVGSWVIAIGNPFGLGGTVTAGIVSARHRNINAGPYDEYIQTDASINRGNSGGPMFNMAGEIIGINTAIFSPSGGSVGIGFAVPSNLARGVVEQLIKYGKTKRGWLGVKIQEVTPEIAETLGLGAARGALVASVTKGGPAEKAGLQAGDVILAFDGKPIDKMSQLPRLVAESEVGKKSSLTFWRKGKQQTATVDLGQLEKAEESGLLAADKKTAGTTPGVVTRVLGLGLAPLTEALRDKYPTRATGGVLVAEVTRDSEAADKDLQPGDVITEVDQAPVTAPEQVEQKVKDAQKAGRASVLLFVARRDDMRFVTLKVKTP